MTCGTVLSDAEPTAKRGILAISVMLADKCVKRIEVRATAAVRCIEAEDSLCWTGKQLYWSNRARTVRDVELPVVGMEDAE